MKRRASSRRVRGRTAEAAAFPRVYEELQDQRLFRRQVGMRPAGMSQILHNVRLLSMTRSGLSRTLPELADVPLIDGFRHEPD